MKNKFNLYYIIFIFFIIPGCAPQIAPHGYLPTSEETQSDTHGGWTKIQSKNKLLSGELIAISSDSIFILSNDQLNVISKIEVIDMRLDKYDSKSINMFGWTTAGIYSTISHGWGLFLSVPSWILTGSIVSSYQSRKPIIEYPNSPFDNFIRFSRFPQGLPDELNRDTLKSKIFLPSGSPKPLIVVAWIPITFFLTKIIYGS